ncbi:MAG: M28 family peptidase [Actinomycetota bacterium]|nr:M28 family peptidase [Actinomycetota bacterium]
MALRRSLCSVAMLESHYPIEGAPAGPRGRVTMRDMRFLAIALIALGVAGLVAALVLPRAVESPPSGGPGDPTATVPDEPPCPGGRPPVPRADRVDEDRAFKLLARQVKLGPRPAGSEASRRLGEQLRRLLPNGRFEAVPDSGSRPGPLRNVVGAVQGRDPVRLVVVGAHYDTKDAPGLVGANDGAGGTAAVVQLARSIRPRQLGPTVVFVLFDGEESPAGTPSDQFRRRGLSGSRDAAREYPGAAAMVLLDFVADRDLSIPREANSTPAVWQELRAAASRVGVGCAFPAVSRSAISDDHVPFLEAGVPAIDLIDSDFDCFHQPCDDLDAVSKRSLDASAEATYELLARL